MSMIQGRGFLMRVTRPKRGEKKNGHFSPICPIELLPSFSQKSFFGLRLNHLRHSTRDRGGFLVPLLSIPVQFFRKLCRSASAAARERFVNSTRFPFPCQFYSQRILNAK